MMINTGEEASVEVQCDVNKTDSPDINFSNASTTLANGLLAIYQPPLEQIKKELSDLSNKQETLLSQIQVENKKLSETLEDIELNEMFNTIKLYHGKLATIKKDMINIHDRTTKLKKRALRLQQIKQKEALAKVQQQEQKLRREQELIGKPVP